MCASVIAGVRKIFADYLRLGSIIELASSLEQEGIKPRPRLLSNGRTIAADRFMVGPLAHLLKNRFYIGEVVFQEETHQGEHQAILDRDLFDAVQAQLADVAVKRRLARSSSPAMLTGLILDDRGNPMTPSHANKKGVRYRYFVSHALLQGRKSAAGSIARVSAPDVEGLVINAIREHCPADVETSDHDLIREHVQRVIVHRPLLEIFMRSDDTSQSIRLTTPFIPNGPRRKGIKSAPSGREFIDAETRDILLKAISRSHLWMRSILDGKMASFDEIAAAENLGERYVRRLAVLAYLSPKIIQAIAGGVAPNGMTVSGLTTGLPHAWAEQEAMFGLN